MYKDPETGEACDDETGEPIWMQGAFNEYYEDFETGRISYSEFCDAIEHLPYIPSHVKESHRRSLEMFIEADEDVTDIYPKSRII